MVWFIWSCKLSQFTKLSPKENQRRSGQDEGNGKGWIHSSEGKEKDFKESPGWYDPEKIKEEEEDIE